ncbi:hypothetical protein GGI07_001123 [Coemansia sp. Benny D115]|nr:hypothetical protein GGI07_001123 [Coemansia sp. Benny D115]
MDISSAALEGSGISGSAQPAPRSHSTPTPQSPPSRPAPAASAWPADDYPSSPPPYDEVGVTSVNPNAVSLVAVLCGTEICPPRMRRPEDSDLDDFPEPTAIQNQGVPPPTTTNAASSTTPEAGKSNAHAGQRSGGVRKEVIAGLSVAAVLVLLVAFILVRKKILKTRRRSARALSPPLQLSGSNQNSTDSFSPIINRPQVTQPLSSISRAPTFNSYQSSGSLDALMSPMPNSPYTPGSDQATTPRGPQMEMAQRSMGHPTGFGSMQMPSPWRNGSTNTLDVLHFQSPPPPPLPHRSRSARQQPPDQAAQQQAQQHPRQHQHQQYQQHQQSSAPAPVPPPRMPQRAQSHPVHMYEQHHVPERPPALPPRTPMLPPRDRSGTFSDIPADDLPPYVDPIEEAMAASSNDNAPQHSDTTHASQQQQQQPNPPPYHTITSSTLNTA